jgi:hypothetical protein
MATMTEQILDECSRRGICPLNRMQFDEMFTGRDLTIQVRAALDFAQAHDLAFARSSGDQRFAFSRLAKASGGGLPQERPSQSNGNGRRHRRNHHNHKKPMVSSNRPYGRSF